MSSRYVRTAMLAALAATAACSNNDPNDGGSNGGGNRFEFRNTSVTPALVKPLETGLTITSLISSDDTLAATPSFVFGGSADGAGLVRNNDGTFTLLTNHEDNFAVSRVILDATFKPVRGEYVLNSTNGLFRMCSASMATPEEHGFGPVFLTSG